MYYFLGIVLQEHITDGSFWPSYVLCQSRLTSEARTGMRVIKQFDGKPSKNLPKILVTEPYGHEALLDFLSVYQTQDKFGGVHYHPKGALCWFSCNKYGDPLGQVIYARKVPIESLMWSFSAKRKFKMRNFNRVRTLPDLLTEEKGVEDFNTKKPQLYQRPNQMINMKGRKRYGNRKRN